jgi:hypothetical protein
MSVEFHFRDCESRSVGEKKDKPLDLHNCNEWVFKFSVFL